MIGGEPTPIADLLAAMGIKRPEPEAEAESVAREDPEDEDFTEPDEVD